GHRCLREPGDRDDVAGGRLFDAGALETAEGEYLGHAAVFDQLSIAIEYLDALVRADRARADASGDDAAEIGIGLQNGAEHAERSALDDRFGDVPGHEIKQRRHALILRTVGRGAHPCFPAPTLAHLETGLP